MSEPQAQTDDRSRATIMMVDDEPTTLEIVEEYLRGAGYRNFVAISDSRKVLELAIECRPDVLLLDLIMPHVDGIEILAAIRKSERLQHLPVIVLTSSTDVRTKLEALDLGATDFLGKPVDAAELALRIRNVLTAKADRDRLADYRAHLERKVVERTAELDLMRIAAERANRAKSQFLANMSHEIRTPMSAILGYTEVLIEGGRVCEDQLESLHTIRRNGDHLLAIINAILDLSRVEAESDQSEKVPIDLVGVITEVARTMQVRADAQGIDLHVEFSSPVPSLVLSDALRIRQALVNLVENAIKFTEEGSVTLRLQYDLREQVAVIDVVDTGIGVESGLIPGLFREFEQGDASPSRKFGGSGLGLAITRALARVLGGSCTMESQVGVGTTVSLRIDAPPADDAEILAVPEQAKQYREPPPESVPVHRIRGRILLAEDGLDNQRLISRILSGAGAEVKVVGNGREALDALRADSEFDLVLMDMAMPEMDGYTATRALRELGFELPVVALTAHALEGEREKCLACGCDDYATKPIDRASLLEMVSRSLERHRSGDRVSVQSEGPELRSQSVPHPSAERPLQQASSGDDPADDSASQLGPEIHKRASIMIVDDEPTTIDVVETFLEGEGYSHFTRTSDPTRAMDLLAEHHPDLLLLDLVMPEMGGLEILRAMREDPAFEHTPVIILTSSTDSQTKLAALELGANDFLAKPVDSSELALRLRNSLNAKAHQDRLAYYDALTGLPNRRHFLERLEGIDRALKRPGTGEFQCTVVYLGLDRFKQIGETLGHRAADTLLKAVADRLEQVAREPLSRIAVDEFALVVPRSACETTAAGVAERLLSSLDEPFAVEGQDLFVTASIGVSLFPNDGEDTETLLRNANVALTHARRARENPIQFYRSSLNAEAVDRLRLESELRGALCCEELLLYYQPKVDLVSRRIIGAEALMRWKHPELGLLLPGKFIPIAEGTDLIVSLGDWALREASRQAMEWLAHGCRPIGMAVNTSGQQFRDGFAEKIRDILEETGLGAEHLVLELTESQIMEDPERAVAILSELRQLGFRISIDDFGTGHSSLSQLKCLPLDELKIDISFIRGVPGNKEDAAIVSTIISLGHNLGLTVVAEGVETEAQYEFLRERECDVGQGYLFARPMPPSDWIALLEGDDCEE